MVLRYRGTSPPAALRELQDELTGPFDAEIAAAGQAVILARGGKTGARRWRGAAACAPAPAAIRSCGEFAEAWLGEGAPGALCSL